MNLAHSTAWVATHVFATAPAKPSHSAAWLMHENAIPISLSNIVETYPTTSILVIEYMAAMCVKAYAHTTSTHPLPILQNFYPAKKSSISPTTISTQWPKRNSHAYSATQPLNAQNSPVYNATTATAQKSRVKTTKSRVKTQHFPKKVGRKHKKVGRKQLSLHKK